jgi:plasmid stability protein
MKTTRLTVRNVDADLVRLMRIRCVIEERDMSEIVNELFRDYLTRHPMNDVVVDTRAWKS